MPTTLTTIKQHLQGHIGEKIQVTAQTGRKRQSRRKGILAEVYPSLFIVSLDQEENQFERVSYSFSDILTNTVEVDFLEEAIL